MATKEESSVKFSRSDKPLVSVITATFNSAHCLPNTIKSIRAQSYENIQWIVIDGASRDSTVDLIKQNEDVIDYWVSEADTGIYDAWNKGLKHAKGEWIAFLGSDDTYYPNAIEDYFRYIQANPDNKFNYISSRVELVNAHQSIIDTIGRPWVWEKFRRKMVVAHVGSMHHCSLFKQYGIYDTTYKTAADYELLLRAREALRAGFLYVTTAQMQVGGASSNMFPALLEAKRAKHETGGRVLILCDLDNMLDMLKILIKKLLFRKWRY